MLQSIRVFLVVVIAAFCGVAATRYIRGEQGMKRQDVTRALLDHDAKWERRLDVLQKQLKEIPKTIAGQVATGATGITGPSLGGIGAVQEEVKVTGAMRDGSRWWVYTSNGRVFREDELSIVTPTRVKFADGSILRRGGNLTYPDPLPPPAPAPVVVQPVEDKLAVAEDETVAERAKPKPVPEDLQPKAVPKPAVRRTGAGMTVKKLPLKQGGSRGSTP